MDLITIHYTKVAWVNYLQNVKGANETSGLPISSELKTSLWHFRHLFKPQSPWSLRLDSPACNKNWLVIPIWKRTKNRHRVGGIWPLMLGRQLGNLQNSTLDSVFWKFPEMGPPISSWEGWSRPPGAQLPQNLSKKHFKSQGVTSPVLQASP